MKDKSKLELNFLDLLEFGITIIGPDGERIDLKEFLSGQLQDEFIFDIPQGYSVEVDK